MNQPREARSYVLLLLESACESYKRASTILDRAKLAAFMDRWIAVSRELYENGVTDFVRECFGLPAQSEIPQKRTPPIVLPDSPPEYPKAFSADEDDIDITGLVEETKETQGLGADVFEKNKTAVAEISVAGNGKSESGTGFIISEKGYLLTNDHVVFDDEVGVYFPKITMKLCGEQKRHKLEVLFSDKKTDVALCKFDAKEVGRFAAVKRIADYSSLCQGADCVVIGNAFAMGLAPFRGEVKYTKDDEGNLVHTAPSNPGDSGGPVFNRKGECIGINKSKTVKVNDRSADGLANATPMDTVEKLLEKWCKSNNIEL